MLNRILFGFYDMPVGEHFYLWYKSRLLRSSNRRIFVVKKTIRQPTRRKFFIRSALYANELHKFASFNVFEHPSSFYSKLKSLMFKFDQNIYDDFPFLSLFKRILNKLRKGCYYSKEFFHLRAGNHSAFS